MNNPLDKLLTEWAYRVHNGMPDSKNPYHLVQLDEYLNELRLPRKVIKKVLEKVRKYKDNKITDLLPDKEKVVFMLRDVEGLSTEKVSNILELTVPAVKSRLHRARLFLRKKLANYFEEYKVRKESK